MNEPDAIDQNFMNMSDETLRAMPRDVREEVMQMRKAEAERKNAAANPQPKPEHEPEPEQETVADTAQPQQDENMEHRQEPAAPSPASEKEEPSPEMAEMLESLRRSEAARRTLMGKYNAETKTLRQQLAEAKAAQKTQAAPAEINPADTGDANNAALAKLEASGWSKNDVDALAEYLGINNRHKSPMTQQQESPSAAPEHGRETDRDYLSYREQEASYQRRDRELDAALTRRGTSLAEFSAVPQFRNLLSQITDEQGNNALELFNLANREGDTELAATILQESKEILIANNRWGNAPAPAAAPEKPATPVRTVMPASGNATPNTPAATPNIAALERAYDAAQKEYLHNATTETYKRYESARIALERAENQKE